MVTDKPSFSKCTVPINRCDTCSLKELLPEVPLIILISTLLISCVMFSGLVSPRMESYLLYIFYDYLTSLLLTSFLLSSAVCVYMYIFNTRILLIYYCLLFQKGNLIWSFWFDLIFLICLPVLFSVIQPEGKSLFFSQPQRKKTTLKS